jgi:peptide/nickel transport system permease protein
VVNFILRKSVYGFLVLIGVVTTVFLLFNVLPGDPARMMLGQRADEESIKAIKKDLGLDQPKSIQFLMYLNDLSPVSVHNEKNPESLTYLDENKYSYTKLFAVGDYAVVLKFPYLRRSYQNKRKVSEIIIEALPETAVLAVTAILIGTILGIILGIIAAIKQGTFFDNAILVISVFGISTPAFFAALIISWIFGYVLSDITGLNMVGSLYEIDDYGTGEYLNLQNLILPAITLGIRPLAIVMQLTRSSLLEVLSQDYIRTAKAKGLSSFKVIFKHALKNALNPVITAMSGWFASLMAGAVYIEMVFDWKGIGYEIFRATEKYDFPIVMGSVLFIATVFVVVNILVDIVYGFLDPRVRVS